MRQWLACLITLAQQRLKTLLLDNEQSCTLYAAFCHLGPILFSVPPPHPHFPALTPYLLLSSFEETKVVARPLRTGSSCALSSGSGSSDEPVLPSRLPLPGLLSAEARGDSVFCFSVCSLARGMMSQFCGRCHTVRCEAAL